MTKKDFLLKNNLTEKDLHYCGKGDFGIAYYAKGKIFKETNSNSEYEYSKKLIGRSKTFTNIVEVFDVAENNGEYYILMEEVNQDSEIEHLFYLLSDLLDGYGYSLADLPGLNLEDKDDFGIIDEDIINFSNELYAVMTDYNNLGVSGRQDIQPNNLGYDKNKTLKAFDIDGEL